jgi:hypothetical protein
MASPHPTRRAIWASGEGVDEGVMSQASARAGRYERTVSRLRWHVNRSPAARLIKWARRAADRRQVALRRRLARGIAVDPRICACADLLTRDGFARVDDVCEEAALAALSAAGEAKLARAAAAAQRQVNTHKSFWTRLLDEDFQDGRLPTDNPFLRFALQEAVIAVVARALGELPRLDTVQLTLSATDNRQLAYSQLWHKDYDDVRTIKLFAYLTDVKDAADGPFTYLPGPLSDRFGFSLRSHRGDAEVLDKLTHTEPSAVIAPRLAAFVVETSRCLHMGSRTAPGRSRLLYTATYITIPRLYPEPPPRFRLLGNESELTRAVLSVRLAL